MLEPSAPSSLTPKLFTDIAKGDTNAFEFLYDQSSRVLFTLAYRILESHDRAAELLEQVYGDIWRREVRYDSRRGSPMAWLVTLTRARAIERLHSDRTRHPGTSMRKASTSAFLPAEGPACEPFAESELRRAITQALANLPVQQQHALELAYYDGLSLNDLSAALNESTGAIMSWLRSGMSQLKSTFTALNV
jgi:RNA polymerase sigma-70 factor (ECF subfamily)